MDIFGALATFIGDVWRTVWLAVGLNPDAVAVARASAHPAEVVIAAAAVAGLIRLLGQSAVLFINRVSRIRFIVTIGVETALYVTRLGVWAWIAWLTAGTAFGVERPFVEAAGAVMVGSAPFVFGFFILVPHLGMLFAQLLRLWSFLATVVIFRAVYGFDVLPAVACAGAGWLAVQALDEVTGRLLLFWRDVVWKRYLAPSALLRPFRKLRMD